MDVAVLLVVTFHSTFAVRVFISVVDVVVALQLCYFRTDIMFMIMNMMVTIIFINIISMVLMMMLMFIVMMMTS